LYTLDNPNAYGTTTGDQFGYSVAISGNYLIVGAYGEDDSDGFNQGKAYIFNLATGSLVFTLDNPNAYDTPTSDGFGSAVAMSGDYAAVAASLEDDSTGTSSGKVYVYKTANGAWTDTVLVKTLDNPNAVSGGGLSPSADLFGGFLGANGISMSGTYLICSAEAEDETGDNYNSGKAYIFNLANL
jgi:hypothetical protein